MSILSRTPSIYQIRHIESGKVYVGSAVNPRVRCGLHMRSLTKGTHHSKHLQRAWNKYGKDAFVFEIVEAVLFIEDLIAREQHWIDALHSCDPAHGFNVAPTAGSMSGFKHSDEVRLANAERGRAQFADPDKRAATSARQKAHYTDPAERQRMADQSKTIAADPAERVKRSERQKAHYADPANRAELSEQAKARFADPVFRAKHGAAQKARYANPEERIKQSEDTKARMADPVYRARQKSLRDERKKKAQ